MTDCFHADEIPHEPGTTRVLARRHEGRWVALSLNLAALIHHQHGNVLDCARKVEQEPDMAGAVIRSGYVSARCHRVLPLYLLTAPVLMGMRKYLHNVPECGRVREIIDAVVYLLEERQAADFRAFSDLIEAEAFVEPEPGVAPIGLECPCGGHAAPKKTLEAAPAAGPPPESWEINAAILLLRRTTVPRVIRDDLEAWNADRLEALRRSRRWDTVGEIYATTNPKGGSCDGT